MAFDRIASLPGAPTPADARVYTDLQALGDLKREAREGAPSALREVAQQFESLFMSMMLKGMREASPEGGLFDDEGTKFYQDMFDQQLSVDLGRKGALGVAAMLERQLSPAAPKPDPATTFRLGGKAYDFSAPVPVPLALPVPVSATGQGPSLPPAAAPDPAAFVREVLPYAERAAARLGVHPHALVAQAALETGWGARMTRGADGTPSHNLFNIKATGGWSGARVATPTLEFEGGVAVRRNAQFRAYDSAAASFDDYVDLIGGNPRYQAALANGDDPVKYAEALQAAGYATDPGYARKIAGILGGDTFRSALKDAGGGPTNPSGRT